MYRVHRFAVLLSALAILLLLSACEGKQPSCREAVESWWAPTLEYAQDPSLFEAQIEEEIAQCEDLQLQAEGADCMDEHLSWRQCLHDRVGQDAGVSAECAWRLERLGACLEGVPFESDCDDTADNDDDGLVDCFDPDCSGLCWGAYQSLSVPQSMDYAADLLFVVDNSANAMILPQRHIAENFGGLLVQLRSLPGGVPSLHIGVTTTDLGAGPLVHGGCAPGGDDGALLTRGCTNPTGGAPYLIYALPTGCNVDREPTGFCTGHDCTQAHCAHEPTTTLVEDPATGCPRCVNFAGESLQDAFACVVDVGVGGCAFSQPLEALHRALDPEHPVNTGFLRDNAYLGLLLATDEDDCSASDPGLFDNSATELESPLGPLTSFRCFEFGFTCDVNDRTIEGPRDFCVARADAEARLHPISRYTASLLALRDPQTLVMAAWGGPVTPSSAGFDYGFRVMVAWDASGLPEVEDSCTAAAYGASPGMRVFELVRQLNDDEALAAWAFGSTCSADFSPSLAGVGQQLSELLGPRCLPAPLRGCADPGVEFGTPRAAQTCAINERCLPHCSVGEVRHQSTDQEYDIWLPFCLDVCTAGYCEGNTNQSLAYAAGHPPDLDPDLPVEACWHIAYNELCEVSNYAELRVARREPAPPRTFAYATCQQISRDEQLCNDGADNDEDCLIDIDDPCCQNSANCAL